MKFFVVEHLEPEVFPWCKLEYAHMSKFVGKEQLIFTNTKDPSVRAFGKVESKPVRELNLKDACVLDPSAKETLTPELAKKFTYFIFGGILGDHPPKKRTGSELTSKMKFPAFNLGPHQMTTDTAVIVTKLIADGKRLDQLQFVENPEIELGDSESVIMPFKYIIVDGVILIPDGLIELLKEEESF